MRLRTKKLHPNVSFPKTINPNNRYNNIKFFLKLRTPLEVSIMEAKSISFKKMEGNLLWRRSKKMRNRKEKLIKKGQPRMLSE